MLHKLFKVLFIIVTDFVNQLLLCGTAIQPLPKLHSHDFNDEGMLSSSHLLLSEPEQGMLKISMFIA